MVCHYERCDAITKEYFVAGTTRNDILHLLFTTENKIIKI